MAKNTKTKWVYFPSPSEWDETDGTERIRRCSALLIDALDRRNTVVTERTLIALYNLRRALLEEHE